jgi:tetratricopeptide (TPR) repeat protein
MNEQQWNQAVKQLELAMQIQRNYPDYNLALGECKMNLGETREAIQRFSMVVRVRPKSIIGWEALICALYIAEFYEEATEQVKAALKHTDNKSIFLYYYSAICFAMGKSKEGLLQLERALAKAPRQVKKFVELNPAILQNRQVVDLLARYKRNKSN